MIIKMVFVLTRSQFVSLQMVQEVASQELSATTDWKTVFTNLPKYNHGKQILYTVTEDTVANYSAAIDGTTITNSYKPGKTSAHCYKTLGRQQ